MPQLLAMDSPFPEQQHTLRLLEPPDSCQISLWERLFARTYSKPFIIDSGLQRRLQFDLFTVQSAMHREHPDRVILAYTRKMMAFLLFNRTPARILLLGLGGGSLAKFCYRRLPYTSITTVEVNRDVIALREEFRIPRDDDRFRVICADAADYMAQLGLSQDVILADACDPEGIAPKLNAIEFYQDAHRCLAPRSTGSNWRSPRPISSGNWAWISRDTYGGSRSTGSCAAGSPHSSGGRLRLHRTA